MFYAHIVLAKKGPLARIWLAAHWDKKLTKAHVFETNIEQSVEGIMQPKVKLALRTSGHLLLGVVRIYSRKAKYLLADCNEAFVKIKMAFRPGIVDLPEGHREAAVNAITLPEVFHDFDTALPELNDVDIEAQFSINQVRADEITMREDYGSLSMSIHDDGFGDMGFDAETPELVRDGMDAHIDEHLFAEELEKDIDQTKEPVPGTSRDILGDDITDAQLAGDGFGEEFGQPAAGLFEGDIFGEAPIPQPEAPELPTASDSNDGMDRYDTGAPSPMPSSIGSRPPSPLGVEERLRAPLAASVHEEGEGPRPESVNQKEEVPAEEAVDQSTLIRDEEESFALAPVDASAYKGVTKAKRKRKLIVDEVKNISGEEMKSQLANTSDIVTTLDLAPPTKRLMYWKETGGVEKLFALPSRDIPARCLFANYQRHLLSRSLGVEDFSMLGPADVLALDQGQEPEVVAAPKRGRKRKLPVPEVPLMEASIPEPEPVRTDAQSRISAMSAMDLGGSSINDTLMPPPPTPGFEPMSSPAQYPMLGLAALGSMTPTLPSIPMTPGALSHGMELHDDFHHTGLTPADLAHGGITPGHPGLDGSEVFPQLQPDQVSSILHAEEGGLLGDDLHLGPSDHHDGHHGEVDLPSKGIDAGNELAGEWTEEFEEFPAPQPGEEQMENETDEQFEERVLNKRAAQMFVAVRNRMQRRDSLFLSEMTYRNTRKQAAQKFYSLLVLKKFRALEIVQDEPYGNILVTKGPMFDNPKL